MKIRRAIFLGLLLSILPIGAAQAITITDRWTGDLNIITGVTQNNANNTLSVSEDYNEDNLIPYPSHDGNAVVDHDPGEPIHFFDKVVDLQGATGDWLFQFTVTNTTQWNWSDYHFAFYDAQFLNPIDMTNILFGWSNTVIFQNSSLNQNELQFWAPANQVVGQTADYRLALHLGQLPTTFGIRQIATVPEPTTLALMALGLGVLGLRRDRQRQRDQTEHAWGGYATDSPSLRR